MTKGKSKVEERDIEKGGIKRLIERKRKKERVWENPERRKFCFKIAFEVWTFINENII